MDDYGGDERNSESRQVNVERFKKFPTVCGFRGKGNRSSDQLGHFLSRKKHGN